MPKKRNAFFKTVFSFSQCQQEGEVLFGSAAFLGYSLVNRYFPKKLKYLKLLQLSLLTLEIVNSCAYCPLLVDLTLYRESIKDRKEHSLRNMFYHTDMSLLSVSTQRNQKLLQSWSTWIKHISGHCSPVKELLKNPPPKRLNMKFQILILLIVRDEVNQ